MVVGERVDSLGLTLNPIPEASPPTSRIRRCGSPVDDMETSAPPDAMVRRCEGTTLMPCFFLGGYENS